LTERRVVEVLRNRSRFLSLIRDFFAERGFWEVETAYLRRFPGLDPNVFSVKTELGFLHTSPEYGMKKLLGMGADAIFQLCKVFRKEEEDELHRVEFTMLEWYKKGKDYRWLIEFSYELLLFLAERLGVDEVEYRGRRVRLTEGYELFSLDELFGSFFGKPFTEIEESELLKLAASFGYRRFCAWEEAFLFLYVDRIEPFIALQERPVYLVDFPLGLSPMAKAKTDKPVAERVELVIAGVEIMNGYSELTDPVEQRRRLLALAGGKEELIDSELIELLGGIKDAAGAAIGVDRLFMLYDGKNSLEEVCFKL